jgi:uncharacterized protein
VTASLLDVNMLVALIDPAHIANDIAHDWFERSRNGAWATCPLTQNGVLRILGHAGYPNTPGPPASVAPIIRRLCEHRDHVFWPDEISLLTMPAVDIAALGASRSLTDTYLLALAVSRGGRLVTLDRRLSTAAVRGGKDGLIVVE